MSFKPKVSFITITYNGLSDTCALIQSINDAVKSVSYEIIVIDNASKSDEAKEIHSKYPFVVTIRSNENRGFSGGNNLGITQAKGDYLFIINNDTLIKEDHLTELIDRLEQNPVISGVSPKIRFAVPPYSVQYAGFTPLTPITLRNETIGYNCLDDGNYDTAHSTPYLHGAAMLLKKEAIDRVGLMPEIYFLYYEELDWSISMQKAGYELWYDPCQTIFHKESQSTGQSSPLQAYYMTRNRLLLAYRQLPSSNRFLSISYQYLIALPKAVFFAIFKQKWAILKATIKGGYDFYRMNKQ